MSLNANNASRASLIVLLGLAPALAQNPLTTVSVDATANRHAINPNIYGVAYGDARTTWRR